MKPYQLGIDLGGTKIESILFDPEGKELHRERIPTPRDTNEATNYRAILESVHGLILDTASLIPPGGETTIGIGIPGTLNRETNLVQNANTTCLADRPFKGDIENLLEREVGIENDANCFTLAERIAGAAKGYRMVFGIIMGTGCGGGLCIDGHIHEGNHSIAGEWGHFSIDPKGEKCWCGNRGCIETKLAGTGVENAFFKKYSERLEMRDIVKGYKSGEPRCVEAFEQFLDDFGRFVGGLISIIDPDAIVLGGGLSNIEALYTLGIERVRHYAFHQHVKTPILKNSLGDSAGVYGAAWIGV